MSLDRALTWFANIWIALVLLLNILAIAGMFFTAHSFWEGLNDFREIYNPFNTANFIVEVISLLPAIGAIAWREKRRAKLPSFERRPGRDWRPQEKGPSREP